MSIDCSVVILSVASFRTKSSSSWTTVTSNSTEMWAGGLLRALKRQAMTIRAQGNSRPQSGRNGHAIPPPMVLVPHKADGRSRAGGIMCDSAGLRITSTGELR